MRLNMSLLKKISNTFTSKITRPILSNIFDYVLVGLCLLCSGYSLFTTSNTTPRTVFTCVTFFVILARFVLTFDLSTLKEIKKNKRLLIPLPSVWCFLLLGISAVITLFVNNESTYFISYFYYGILVFSAFLLCYTISFKRFIKVFCDELFYLTIIAILLFALHNIVSPSLGFLFFDADNTIFSNSFLIFTQNEYVNRIHSIFWEAGVFASFLLLALAFELLFSDNFKLSHIIVFLVALIFTFSTAGYLLAVFIIGPFFIYKIKNQKVRTAFEYAFIPVVVLLLVGFIFLSRELAKFAPTLFEKIAKESNSFTTRLYSPKINLEIFLEKPFFGWGIHGSNERYLEVANAGQYETLIDAQTSTSFGLLARFGVFGIIYTLMMFFGIVFDKKMQPLSLVCVFLLFFVIVNKEPHGNMLISWALLFFFVHNNIDQDIIEKRHKKSESPVYEKKTLLDVIESKGDSGTVARNTFLSLGLKGVALLVGLFTIPIYSKYFGNDSTYGIWLTFLSIITWVMTFDLGFGNGMKNKLIETISKKDNEEGKRIVSSTYAASLAIGSVILAVGLLIINLIDLVSLFNFDPSVISTSTVRIAFCITFSTIAIEFVLKNISHIFQAHQKHFLSNLLPLLANITLLIFASTSNFGSVSDKLLFISIAYCVITLSPYLIASLIAFLGPLKSIAPSFKYASFSKGRSVISLGLLFFLIQLALLFLNSMDQILVSSIFSSEDVVLYTKYSKFFNVIISISNIFNNIMWTSVCKSISDNNKKQLNKGIKSLLAFDLLMCLICLIIALFMQPLLDVWLGESSFSAQPFIIIIILLFTIENIFVSSTGSLLNGFQCLLPQAISVGAAAIAKIALVFIIHNINNSIGWELVFIVNVFVYLPILTTNLFFLYKSYKKFSKKVETYGN